MTLAEKIESLTGQLEQARATIEASASAKIVRDLQQENAALRQERDASAAELQTMRARVIELETGATANADAAAKLSAANVEIESFRREILATRKSVEAQANARAIEIMAAVGQPMPVKHDARNIADEATGEGIGYAEYLKKLPTTVKK